MSQANVRIDIASELHNKGFKDAEKATSSLDKAVTKLGHKLTTAFSAYKILQFGKDSVKAFAADQKAAAVLAKTLENVNQGYQTDIVNSYIAKTEALYGVLDEKLRPAFAQLVVATGDATKSQALLQTALDVSAGTGKDLQEVTSALSKAYLGNNTALTRLGVGLSATELKGKSFNDIIDKLNLNFTGQALNAANTYQGQLDRLNVAFDNMKETIGKGLVDAFTQAGGSQGFNGFLDGMSKLAEHISNVVVGIGVLIGKIQKMPIIGQIFKAIGSSIANGPLGWLDALGAKAKIAASQSSVVTNFLLDMKKIAAGTAKANASAKQLLTTTKALTKEQKDQLALKQAAAILDQKNSIFNLDQIEIAAAMMSKQTAEDYARLKLKKDILDLQDAINRGDAAAATTLAATVEDDYKRVWAYQAVNIAAGIQAGLITNIKNAANLIPKDIGVINLDNLQSALDYINKMLASLNQIASTATKSPVVKSVVSTATAASTQNLVSPASIGLTDAQITAVQQAAISSMLASPASLGLTDLQHSLSSMAPIPQNIVTARSLGLGDPIVNVTITDNAKNLVDVVMDTTQQQSASGIPTQITRNAKNLAW